MTKYYLFDGTLVSYKHIVGLSKNKKSGKAIVITPCVRCGGRGKLPNELVCFKCKGCGSTESKVKVYTWKALQKQRELIKTLERQTKNNRYEWSSLIVKNDKYERALYIGKLILDGSNRSEFGYKMSNHVVECILNDEYKEQISRKQMAYLLQFLIDGAKQNNVFNKLTDMINWFESNKLGE